MKMKGISFPHPIMNPCNQIVKIRTATPTSIERYRPFQEQTNNSTVAADEKHIGSASVYYEENQHGNGGRGGGEGVEGGWWWCLYCKIVTSATLGFIHKSSCCLSFAQSHSALREKR